MEADLSAAAGQKGTSGIPSGAGLVMGRFETRPSYSIQHGDPHMCLQGKISGQFPVVHNGIASSSGNPEHSPVSALGPAG